MVVGTIDAVLGLRNKTDCRKSLNVARKVPFVQTGLSANRSTSVERVGA